jgi:hypothetical protein
MKNRYPVLRCRLLRPRRHRALAGSEERADWEGSASVEHHSCSVSDGSRVQNAVGHSRENFESHAPLDAQELSAPRPSHR